MQTYPYVAFFLGHGVFEQCGIRLRIFEWIKSQMASTLELQHYLHNNADS